MLIELIETHGPWAWAILGLILLVAELLLPGIYLFWFGLAAIAVALLTIVNDIPWQMQVVVFCAIAVVFVFLSRRFMNTAGQESDDPLLNKRAERLVGREFVLEKPVENGYGTVKIDDTVWRIAAEDVPAGTRIRITAADGPVLQAEPAAEKS